MTQNKNNYYLIVGKINEKKKFLDLNLESKTTILNFNNFVDDLIQTSDIIIFPSKNEGFGRVMIEAMLLKTYFIVSNSGAHNELIINNKNGFISKTNTSNEYVDIISKILKNKKKYNTIKVPNFVKSKFSVQKYLVKIKTI